MTQTQKDNDFSSITSYSGDEDAGQQQAVKKQKKANDSDSSDLWFVDFLINRN